MRVRSLSWAVAAITGAVAWIAGSGPALGAVGSASAIIVYDCAGVVFNPVTAEATGHGCARGADGAPGLTGYALNDQAQGEEYACDNVSTSPDPKGGLIVSGTGCERVVAP
ncbi:hypothetical protein D0T12_22480 [Actinomadura spongiicola]|uniref:Uncharacterized protein n=1 Tax=Actinomadura spongiicola TaxID=2303421 RepID=A0A372GC68_9ACTN|nr:hypothetical protein [Actinomadura spongiicola]RFS82971.1 hypothetical protein D0T12_22480 [Actinomadura spongiicola]